MTTPLIPREPRRMRQPSKDELRKQLATAADEMMRLRAENDRLRWWRRLPILRRRA